MKRRKGSRTDRLSLAAICFPALLFGAWAGFVGAQISDYPTQAIRTIVPFPAGGPADIVARLYSQRMSAALGQTFVVDNRGGAGGNIGAELVAKSKPNGHTLLFTTNALLIAPFVYKDLGFNPVNDFVPIGRAAVSTLVLLVHPSLPVKTVSQLIALARANPGAMTVAASSIGTPLHLSAELFKSMARINIVNVPYKGSAPASQDLLAGQVTMMFDSTLLGTPLIRAGRLRGLAVSTRTRSASLPDIPTMAESGLPDYEASVWYAYFAPKGTDKMIIDTLVRQLQPLISERQLIERLAQLGTTPVGGNPRDLESAIRRELPQWQKLVNDLNITAN
jgi:tripartite-type tricarboxylate transporter receptor subunit TctC